MIQRLSFLRRIYLLKSRRPLLKRRIKLLNTDTYDCMDIIIDGYFVEDFALVIKEFLKKGNWKTIHTQSNKWKIIKEEELFSNGVGFK